MRSGSPRFAGALVAGLLVGGMTGQVRADSVDTTAVEEEIAPPRYASTLSVGVPLRLTRHEEFDQGAVAPLYTDLLVGYVLSSHRSVRHGVGLGLSMNLTRDGGFTEPVDPGDQLVVMPSYLLYWMLANEWFGLGHLGIPLLTSGGRSAGLEIGAGVGYRWLAGVGTYGEVSLAGVAGGSSTVHASASLEVGLFIDYEVLP